MIPGLSIVHKIIGSFGLAAILLLSTLLALSKAETRHWREQSDGNAALYREEKVAHALTVSGYRAKAEEARAADAANVIRVERDQSSVNQETDRDYQTQLADLRRRYDALRVRTGAAAADPRGSGSPPVPGLPGAAGGADGSAVQDGLPLEDALIASEQALQLDALQNWVRRQAAVER
jgi:hypothetical protein